jgi:ectoine hydroxylase-related dioxygenase (phytanoyl-CoA dioxygenase family)
MIAAVNAQERAVQATLHRVSDEDRYVFDVQGYLHLRGVLSADEVTEINDVLDDHADELVDMSWTGNPGGTHPRADFLLWDESLRNLLDHPRIIPYLEQWVDPAVRLDHCYGIFTQPGTRQLPMHHGGTPFHHFAYHVVQPPHIYNGLVVVSWALNTFPVGQGTFTCIPGSHRAAFRCPPAVTSYERELECVTEVPLGPGDVVIFSEAITHGAKPWTTDYQRRNLLFKYAPGCLAWSNERWRPELLELATPRQRRLLRPPYVHDVTAPAPGFRTAVSSPDYVPLLSGPLLDQ